MPAKRKTKSTASSLVFISDAPLRQKIQDAIETITFLYLFEQDPKTSAGLARELRRTMILYYASIVEAVLLFLYKKKSFSMTRPEYTNVHTLPQIYQLDSSYNLVFSRLVQKPRLERDLMLDVLLKFFLEQKIITTPLKDKIDRAKNVRNTFHLSKSRKGIQCGPKAVQIAAAAAVDTIVAVEAYLIKNP